MKNLIELTFDEAKETLLKNEAENAEHIDNLNFHARNNIDAHYYSAYGALIITESFRGKTFTDIIPTENSFDVAGICGWLTDNRKEDRIGISVQHLSESQRTAVTELLADTHSPDSSTKCYLFTAQTTPSADEHIRPLTADDKEAFCTMEFTKEPNRPPQEILFDHYIIAKREEGEILAYFEDGKILGYLPYYKASDNYFDTDYIWTAPSRRKEGIGSKLTDAYVNTILNAGGVPMWSNPATEISAHIAESHGFTVIRETIYYKAK